ncbi:hypothetical protein BKA65DRAFT_566792 [Rhexocercosporidium sp. MPI-PUGE-AT-0058]|nr:hypothetical protein BKA65DRAFT_566792 [Rhexocercosporidium sp. MPI-PUGE-AT-0058]
MASRRPKNTSLSRALTLNIIFAFHILLLSAFTFGILSTNTNTNKYPDISTDTYSKFTLPYFTRAHNIRFDALEAQIMEVMDCAQRVLGMEHRDGIGMEEKGRGDRISRVKGNGTRGHGWREYGRSRRVCEGVEG